MMHADHDTAPKTRGVIFWTAVLALFAAGLAASLRAAVAGDIRRTYLDPIDFTRSATMIAEALGIAFLGFTAMLIVSSALLDKVGMKRMLFVAVGCFLGSAFLLTFAGALGEGMTIHWLIMAGMFASGLAHGAVEGTINPLVGALYPEDKTHRMNVLHAWWPAGLVAGSLLGAFGGQIGIDWRIIFSSTAVCAVALGFMMIGRQFPVTASRAIGLPVSEQCMEVVRRPSFLIWFALMLFTAATELAPSQWVDVALTNVVGMRGILLIAYLAAIMFVGRHFAGPLERRLSTEGLLTISCILSAIGLYLLGSANSPVTALLATTVWGVGVCFLWPTMIAVAAERYPRGGAVTIGLIGVAGSISTYFILPVLGAIYDRARIDAAGGTEALAQLTDERMQAVLVFAAGESFRAVALIPAALFVIFGLMWASRLQFRWSPGLDIRQREAAKFGRA
jgi:MFS family permease